MKPILSVIWVLFFIWIAGHLGSVAGKMYNKHGWFIAIATLIMLELCWFVIYFIGLWTITVYIP